MVKQVYMSDLLKIVRLFLRQRKWLILAAVFTVAQAAGSLALPRLMAEIMDRGVMRENFEPVMRYGIPMLAVCAGSAMTGYFGNLAGTVGSQRFALELRQELYRRISGMSVQRAAEFGSGSLITRLMTDVQVCASLMCVALQLLLEPMLLLVGGVVMVWTIEPRLGIIFLGFVLVQVVMMVLFVKNSAPQFRRIRLLTDGINKRVQAVCARLQLVKLSVMEQRESDSFAGLNEELVATGMRVQKIVAFFQPLTMLIMDLAVAAILLYAENKLLITGGNVEPGSIMSVISYSQQILSSIVISGRLFQFLTEAAPSAQRINEVLDDNAGMSAGEKRIEGAFGGLSLNGVSFAHPVSGAVLDGLSLSLGPGEFLSVTGVVGSGKSTLASLMARVIDPCAGTVEYNSVPLPDYDLEDVHRKVALVEKNAVVLSGTFRSNLVFGREGIGEEDLSRAVKAAQCETMLAALPEGLDSEVAALGRRLSGGECQRLAIARALAGDPAVLVLDDATTSLDYGTEFDLFRSIREAYPGLAVVLCTQRAASAARADRVAYLGNGRVLQEGTSEEMMRTCPEYRQLFHKDA